MKFLEQNLRHPSLRAKKYDESRGLWQARVSKDWRFYFLIQDDVDILEESSAIRNRQVARRMDVRTVESNS